MTTHRVRGTAHTQAIDVQATSPAIGPTGNTPLPRPQCVGDDFETALAVLMIKQEHDDRRSADNQQQAASKAQQEAQERKIAKMRELADDELSEGIVRGVLGGLSAVATGVGAGCEFSAAVTSTPAYVSGYKLQAGLAGALGKAFDASGTVGGTFAKSAQDRDREDMTRADGDIDRAKSSTETAGVASKRAQDDIRDLIASLRQYIQAKAQLGDAMILKA